MEARRPNGDVVLATGTKEKKAAMEMGPFCSCLVDQDRYIGEDPVGHACYNQANYRSEHKGLEAFFCESCHKLLTDSPERITIGWSPIGHQEEMIRNMLQEDCMTAYRSRIQ